MNLVRTHSSEWKDVSLHSELKEKRKKTEKERECRTHLVRTHISEWKDEEILPRLCAGLGRCLKTCHRLWNTQKRKWQDEKHTTILQQFVPSFSVSVLPAATWKALKESENCWQHPQLPQHPKLIFVVSDRMITGHDENVNSQCLWCILGRWPLLWWPHAFEIKRNFCEV